MAGVMDGCQRGANCSRSAFLSPDWRRPYNAKDLDKRHCLKRSRLSYDGPQRTVLCAAAAAEPGISLIGVGEIVDVEEVEGVRVYAGDDNKPKIEYLVKWKDGAQPTWEPVENLADNLLRDFEDKWWKCCREGDEETMKQMVANSPNVLPFCVDSNERSALHFSAALGKAESCAMLCKAGAEVDLQDKDGYTPLHMAVGYSFVSTVRILLEAGANPEIPDSQARNVVQLVDSIRDSMPFNPQLAQKRIALEEVSAMLTGNLFEEVIPRRILEERPLENGAKEYLVQWYDGEEDSWVKSTDIAQDVIDDYEKGYEYGVAKQLLKMKKRGDERLYLVQWSDGSDNTWEFEDDISPVLVKAYESGKAGVELEKLLSDPSQWNFSEEGQTPKRRRRRRKKKSKPATETDSELEVGLQHAAATSEGKVLEEKAIDESSRPHNGVNGQNGSSDANRNGNHNDGLAKNGNGALDDSESQQEAQLVR